MAVARHFTSVTERALAACGTPATVIGCVTADGALVLTTPEGERFDPRISGYDHFSGGQK